MAGTVSVDCFDWLTDVMLYKSVDIAATSGSRSAASITEGRTEIHLSERSILARIVISAVRSPAKLPVSGASCGVPIAAQASRKRSARVGQWR